MTVAPVLVPFHYHSFLLDAFLNFALNYGETGGKKKSIFLYLYMLRLIFAATLLGVIYSEPTCFNGNGIFSGFEITSPRNEQVVYEQVI